MSSGKPLIGRNFAILSAGQIASRILAFFTTVHVAGLLLPEKFGAITFATGALLYAGLIVDFGFDFYGPIVVGRGTADLNKLAGNVITWRALFVVPAIIGLFVVANLLPISPFARIILEVYGISLIANALDLGWVFLGSKQMWPSALGEMITQTIVAVGAFTLIHGPAQAVVLPILFLIGRFSTISFLIALFLNQYGKIQLGIDWPYMVGLLKKAIPLSGSQLMGLLIANFDLMLLALWMGTAAAGLYGAATRIVWLPVTIAVSYYTSIRPIVAHAFVSGFDSIEPLFHRTVRWSTALASGVLIGGIMLAHPIIVRIFGPSYQSADVAFALLVATFFFMILRSNYRLILMTFDRQLWDFRIMTAAAVVNIVLNLLLIPKFGIAGAGVANLSAEVLVLALDYAYTRSLIRERSLVKHWAMTAVSCGAMALFIKFVPVQDIYIKVALSGLVYLSALLATGVIAMEEITSTLKTFKSKRTPAFAPPLPVEASSVGKLVSQK